MPRSEAPPRWRDWAQRCETTLADAINTRAGLHAPLAEAMAYASLDGGKRIRPLLVYATGTALGVSAPLLDLPAAAVELIHAYSLVHDDLPAMDNDALRRGKPTVHVAWGEASAILVGDALQALAFELLAATPVAPGTALAMIQTLARAAGMQGMVAGQAIDLDAVGQALTLDALQAMHAAKTGALIRAAVALGAQAAGADDATRATLDDYATALGLAFQIRDDLLDVEGDPALTGKSTGADAARAKPTYPTLLGPEACRHLLETLTGRMQASLATLDKGVPELAQLARFATQRQH